MLKIDLHIHTSYSDSSGSVDEILREAKHKGLDGIAITDHKTVRGAYEALKRCEGLIVIVGQEVRTRRCEILALGIRKKIEDDLPLLRALDEIHRQNGLAILPHPTVPFFRGLKEEKMKNLPIDGIEVFSAITPLPWYFMKRNLEIARRLKKFIVAGSDSHSAKTVGDAYTIVNCKSRNVRGVLRAIKLGRTSIGGGPSKLSFKMRMIGNMIPHVLFKLTKKSHASRVN